MLVSQAIFEFGPLWLVALNWLAREHGVYRSAWVLTGAAVLVGILLIASVFRRAPQTAPAAGRTA